MIKGRDCAGVQVATRVLSRFSPDGGYGRGSSPASHETCVSREGSLKANGNELLTFNPGGGCYLHRGEILAPVNKRLCYYRKAGIQAWPKESIVG